MPGATKQTPDSTELPEIYDYLLKLILIGDSGVGKSCLMHHFLNNSFRNPSPHTIGVEFSSTLLRLPSTAPSAPSGPVRPPPPSSSSSSAGAHAQAQAQAPRGTSTSSSLLKVQIWDTAGQERFRSVTRNYYRGACGAVLVYDITNRSTFTNLSMWLSDARALASPDLVVVLVGNKVDSEDSRQVSYLEASRWAKENDVLYMETSSLSGENVQQPFVLLARSILFMIESGKLDPGQAGSGVSFGERTLRRVSSWGSRRSGRRSKLLGGGGGCC